LDEPEVIIEDYRLMNVIIVVDSGFIKPSKRITFGERVRAVAGGG